MRMVVVCCLLLVAVCFVYRLLFRVIVAGVWLSVRCLSFVGVVACWFLGMYCWLCVVLSCPCCLWFVDCRVLCVVV